MKPYDVRKAWESIAKDLRELGPEFVMDFELLKLIDSLVVSAKQHVGLEDAMVKVTPDVVSPERVAGEPYRADMLVARLDPLFRRLPNAKVSSAAGCLLPGY